MRAISSFSSAAFGRLFLSQRRAPMKTVLEASDFSPIQSQLDRIELKLDQILAVATTDLTVDLQERQQTMTISSDTAKILDETTYVKGQLASIEHVLQYYKQKLLDNAGDAEAIRGIAGELAGVGQRMHAAVAANPIPSDPPSDPTPPVDPNA